MCACGIGLVGSHAEGTVLTLGQLRDVVGIGQRVHVTQGHLGQHLWGVISRPKPQEPQEWGSSALFQLGDNKAAIQNGSITRARRHYCSLMSIQQSSTTTA